MSKEVTIMGKTAPADLSARTRGELQPVVTDRLGRLITYPYTMRDGVSTGSVSLTNGTKTELMAAGGANVYNDLVLLYGQNTSTNAITVTILDESTEVDVFSAAASSRFNREYPIPLPQGSANVAWYADLGDDNNSTVTIKALAVKNK